VRYVFNGDDGVGGYRSMQIYCSCLFGQLTFAQALAPGSGISFVHACKRHDACSRWINYILRLQILAARTQKAHKSIHTQTKNNTDLTAHFRSPTRCEPTPRHQPQADIHRYSKFAELPKAQSINRISTRFPVTIWHQHMRPCALP
jgi:hypothetical protein